MEDLTKNWNNLSLSDKEDTGFVLPKVHKSRDFIIAAKFLNFTLPADGSRGSYLKATLEICEWFQSPKFGRSYSAFCFDNSSDVERIFQNQPWSSDKYLVVITEI